MKKGYMNELTRQAYIDKINQMDQEEMARQWRFAPAGDPLFDCQYDLFEIFQERFKSLGGFTPELSKKIGHGDEN